ncbi:MAG TPA: hypothetical protein VIW69_11180 [Candidatus Elarobacter sp.]
MGEAGTMLSEWNSFYVMMGSSAAALTGLVFIVVTLIRDQSRRGSEAGMATFTTPTVVHFGSALFTSALMAVPFRSLVPIAIVLGITGAGGLIYAARIAIQTSRLESYRPDAEDWTWHVALPFIAYAALVIGAIAMHGAAGTALYAPAAAVLLLIFIGIHNAWDVVTFLATGKAEALSDHPTIESAAEKSD